MEKIEISNFIDSCILRGKTSITSICEEARLEISSLDEEIKKIEKVRIRKELLKNVIKHLGGEKPTPKAEYPSSSFEECTTDMQIYIKKILELINKNKDQGISNRKMMDALASSIEEQKLFMNAIKWLWEKKFISKKESIGREIIPGLNWDSRPGHE